MSRREELVSLYKKERRRVQSYYSRYAKKNYSIPENAIPAIPKRITEGSVRRLQRMTPEYMKRKLVREEKRIQREEKRYQKWLKQNKAEIEKRYHRDLEEAYQKGVDSYYESLSSFDMAKMTGDYAYLNEYTNAKDRMEKAEQFFEESITDMRERDLEKIGFTKTDDGFIIDKETNTVVARDMTKEQIANNEFLQDMQQETGQDMTGFIDVDFEWEQIVDMANNNPQDYDIVYNDNGVATRVVKKKTESTVTDYRQDKFRGRSKDSWAQAIINNYVKDIRKFQTYAYPMLQALMNELLYQADESNIGTYKEALAKAIQSIVDEYGRMTTDIAYNLEVLNNYGSAFSEYFYDNLQALESLNAEQESHETGYEEH